MEESIHRILKAAREAADRKQEESNTELINNLKHLEMVDSGILESINKVVSHITETFKDKYESDLPEIDLYNLMRQSPHGKGFNVGNSSKYNKRYLTSGFDKSGDVKDLYKSIHYLLMEIDRNENQ